MQLVAVVAGKSQIQSVSVVKGSFRREPIESELPTNVDYSFSVGNTFDKEAKVVQVQVSFVARAKYSRSDKDGKAPITIDADFVLDYSLDSTDGIEPKHIEAFSRMNGVYNAWPYWREYVQSMSVRLGLPALTLPLMTGDALQALYEKQEQDSGATTED